jgi:hypothetical protein
MGNFINGGAEMLYLSIHEKIHAVCVIPRTPLQCCCPPPMISRLLTEDGGFKKADSYIVL